jgi:hypothetical protein
MSSTPPILATASSADGRLSKQSGRPSFFINAVQSSSTASPALSECVMPLQSTSRSRALEVRSACSPSLRAALALAKFSAPRAANRLECRGRGSARDADRRPAHVPLPVVLPI